MEEEVPVQRVVREPQVQVASTFTTPVQTNARVEKSEPDIFPKFFTNK